MRTDTFVALVSLVELLLSVGFVHLDIHARDHFNVRKRPIKSLLPTRLVVEFPLFRECADTPNNGIKYFNVTTTLVGRADFLLSGFFNITRTVKDISEIVLILIKCKDSVSVNNCENFQTWRFSKNTCQIFNSNKMWESFQRNVFPRPKCPSVPGTYEIRNSTIDINILQALPMPLEGHVYRVKHLMMEPNGRPHVCTEVELRFHRARN